MTPRWPGALLGEAALFLGRNLLASILLSGRKTCCCVREAIWCVLVCQLLGKGLTRQACCERVPGTVLTTDCEASPLSAGQTGTLLAAHSQLLSGLTCVASHLQACKVPADGPGPAPLSLAIGVCSKDWLWAQSVSPSLELWVADPWVPACSSTSRKKCQYNGMDWAERPVWSTFMRSTTRM